MSAISCQQKPDYELTDELCIASHADCVRFLQLKADR